MSETTTPRIDAVLMRKPSACRLWGLLCESRNIERELTAMTDRAERAESACTGIDGLKARIAELNAQLDNETKQTSRCSGCRQVVLHIQTQSLIQDGTAPSRKPSPS